MIAVVVVVAAVPVLAGLLPTAPAMGLSMLPFQYAMARRGEISTKEIQTDRENM